MIAIEATTKAIISFITNPVAKPSTTKPMAIDQHSLLPRAFTKSYAKHFHSQP